MRSILLRGGSVGAMIGLVVSQVIGLAVIGTDDIPDIADRDQLGVLYVVAAVIGLVVGAVTGMLGLAAAAVVARGSSAAPARRRVHGALAAGAVSGVTATLTTSSFFFDQRLLVLVLLALVGGVAAWFVLPHVVDVDTLPSPEKAATVGPQQVGPQLSATAMPTWRRALLTIVVAGAGSLVIVNVVATAVPSMNQPAAWVLLVVVCGGLGAIVWRGSARGTVVPEEPH